MFPNGFAAEAGRRRGRDKGKNNREKLGLKSPTIASFHVRSNRRGSLLYCYRGKAVSSPSLASHKFHGG